MAVATQRALASSLLELPPHGDTIDGDIPSLSDLLAETRFDVPAGPSRLPPPPKTGWRAPETDTLLPKTGRRAQEMDIMRKKYCSVLE